MRVKELISELKLMDEEMEVGFSYNYGDYQKTMVVSKVFEVGENEVVYSEYHRSKRIADEEEIIDPKIKTEVMVVLS